MIPRRRTPRAPEPAAPAPLDAGPMIEHRAIELDFSYGPGELLSITLNEGDTMREADDRFVIEYANGERATLYKPLLRWVSRRERTWQTAPEPFKPAEEA